MLISITQTRPNPFFHSAYPRNHGAFGSLRALLQKLPSVYQDTRLRNKPSHLPRSHPAPRPILVYTSRIFHYTRRSPQ